MSKIRDYQQQVQDVIEKGINTVEKQHKSLAERPFELAEKAEKQVKNYSIKSVHAKHDDYANTAYETLRVWNKRLGDYATDLIGRFDKEATDAQSNQSSSASGSTSKQSTSKQGSTAKKSTGGAKKQASSSQQASA